MNRLSQKTKRGSPAFCRGFRRRAKIISGFLIVVSTLTLGFSPDNFIFGEKIAEAAFNKEINYQGKLTNTSNVAVADGNYIMKFRLYTTAESATTTKIWEEIRTATGDKAVVSNGLFSVMLGSSTPLTSVDFNQTLYLGVEVCGTVGLSGCDNEMTPRKRLGAVPAAFEADRIDGLSSEQFLRSDAVNSTSTATTWLTFTQNGVGKIAEFIGPNSASVLNILSGGNVGVGTTTPFAKLAVHAYSGETNTRLFEIASSTASATTTLFVVTNTGQVAIATTTPNNLLDIYSTTKSAIGFSGASGPTYKWTMGMDVTNAGRFSIASSTALGTTDRFVIDGNGNVGIGTTSPFAKLGVVGAIPSIGDAVSVLYVVGGNGGTGGGQGAPITLITGNASNAQSGNGSTGGAFSIITGTGGNGGSLGGAGGVGGSVSITAGAGGAGGVISGINGNGGSLTFNPGAAGSGGGGGGGSAGNIILADLRGKVAIATTTPNNILDIYSTTKSAIGFSGASGPTYKWTMGMDVTNGGRFSIASSTALGTTDRFVIDGDGNVGIGTTSPYAKLSVVGEAVVSYFSATSTAATSTIAGSLNVESGGLIYDRTTNRVGIGTLSPLGTLHVVGDTYISSGSKIIDPGNANKYIQLDNGSAVMTFSQYSSFLFRATDPTAYVTLLQIIGPQNASSGTGLPVQFTPSIRQSGTAGYTAIDLNVTEVSTGSGSRLLQNWRVGSASKMVITSDGNLGVATTSPWRTLSVVGTVAFNGLTSSGTGNAVCIATSKDITDAGGGTCTGSSIRFKENIKTLEGGFAFETLNKLRVVSFDYKKGMYSPEDRKESYGFIAEEVEEIDQNLVDYGYDGRPLTLKFEKILGLAVQSIQELGLKTESLENRVAGLEQAIAQGGGGRGGGGGISLAFVLDGLRSLGADISQGVARFRGLFAQTFTVGSPERPTGITLYDEITGKPYCVKISKGQLKNTSGQCEEQVTDSGPAGGSAASASILPPVEAEPSELGTAEIESESQSEIIERQESMSEIDSPTESEPSAEPESTPNPNPNP